MYVGLFANLEISMSFLSISLIYYKRLICPNYPILIKHHFTVQKRKMLKLGYFNKELIIINCLGIYSKKANPDEVFGINTNTTQ